MRRRPIRSAQSFALTKARPNSSEVRQPIPATPGQLERYDCEYKRNGTANLFIFLDVHRPWRKVKVTNSRAAVDFAACMRELTDLHFHRVVLDPPPAMPPSESWVHAPPMFAPM